MPSLPEHSSVLPATQGTPILPSMNHHHLNILPIEIPDVSVEVGIMPFDSHEVLKLLRKEHSSQYLFKRAQIDSIDSIIALRLDGEAYALTGEKRDIKLRDHLGLVASLTMERFLSSFSGKATRRVVDVNPLKVLSSLPHRTSRSGVDRSRLASDSAVSLY